MTWLTNVLIFMAFCFSGVLAVATFCYRPVVIVGGGPVGLTSALLLESLGFKDVTVLEQRDNGKFDTERSYLYLIDRRGGKTLDALDLSHKLELRAVKSKEFTSLTELRTDGSTKVIKLPVIPGGGDKHWVPRSVVIETLLEEIAQRPTIKVIFNASVNFVNSIYLPDGEMNNTLVVSGTGFSKINTGFLLGCDGQNSRVRDFLATSYPNKDNSKYESISFPSPSADLHFKILSIAPNFPLPGSGTGTGTREASNPTTGYAIRGVGKSSRSRLSLGLLPVRKGAPRTANVIAPADHDVWKRCTSLEATIDYFEKQFPQLQPSLTDFFSVEELTRFASTKCGVFPRPAYTKKLTKTTYGGGFTECNVVLLGDSAHVFPPDLGQGINSGLEDAFVLAKSLARWKNREPSLAKYDQGLGFSATEELSPFSIGNALSDFELNRLPEAKAIAEISSFAFPYQYNQGKWFMKTLALLNFALRIALNRLSPNQFLLPTFLLVQRDPPIKYSEILSMSTDSTRNIYHLFSILFTTSFLFAWRAHVFSLMATLSKAHFAFFGALSFIAFNTICLLRSEPGEAITLNRLIRAINHSLMNQKVNLVAPEPIIRMVDTKKSDGCHQ